MTAPLIPGQKRKLASVSLTHEQQIQLRRLGGSKWLRSQIEKATPPAAKPIHNPQPQGTGRT